MATSTTSFTKTPQAGDDIYSWTEDSLIASGLLVGNIVMSGRRPLIKSFFEVVR